MKKTKYMIAALTLSLGVSVSTANAATLKVVVNGAHNASLINDIGASFWPCPQVLWNWLNMSPKCH
jgi:hypothetical protein